MLQKIETLTESPPFVRKVALPSFTACWCAPSAFLADSGQLPRLALFEPHPHNSEHYLSETGNYAEHLNGDFLLIRSSETWKVSKDHRATVYTDTEAGTIQYVMSVKASRVWLACDGTKNISSIMAECGGEEHTKKFIAAFLEEGLLLCELGTQSFS